MGILVAFVPAAGKELCRREKPCRRKKAMPAEKVVPAEKSHAGQELDLTQ